MESTEGSSKLAQYSFFGFKPSLLLTVKDNIAVIQNFSVDERIKTSVSDPLKLLKSLVGRRSNQGKYRFTGGAVGYISYDAIRYWEDIPKLASDDLGFPDIQMGLFNDGIVYDHFRHEASYFYRGEDRSRELEGLANKTSDTKGLSLRKHKINIEKERYEEKVKKARDYIASGDILQVVISKRHDFEVQGKLTRFYEHLRKINPSPYMYFLKMGKRRIVGSSPEMLVRVDGRKVDSFPIAGTRPRVEDPVHNNELARELLSDPKERAEHIMLVDLSRNDLGKISSFGSVHVQDLMEVHEYSHVQHIVSRVSGELRKDCDCFDVFKAVFPAGTVSGAPKVRAMEIIEESEPTRRGPYAGAVGYFSFNGNADFAITIRTLVSEGDRCSIQVGAGIVADSIPEKEWFETEFKSSALIKALELAESQN